MRGHRSRFAHFALALLLGAAGASSSRPDPAQASPAPELEGPAAVAATAQRSPLWTEALKSSNGLVRLGAEERTGSDTGDRPRAASPRAAQAWPAPRLPERCNSGSPPGGAAGARLLGLPNAPANAPPGS